MNETSPNRGRHSPFVHMVPELKRARGGLPTAQNMSKATANAKPWHKKVNAFVPVVCGRSLTSIEFPLYGSRVKGIISKSSTPKVWVSCGIPFQYQSRQDKSVFRACISCNRRSPTLRCSLVLSCTPKRGIHKINIKQDKVSRCKV